MYIFDHNMTVLAVYHTPRSAATWYWLGQCSWTCCRSFTVEGADSWHYAPLWCMLLMIINMTKSLYYGVSGEIWVYQSTTIDIAVNASTVISFHCLAVIQTSHMHIIAHISLLFCEYGYEFFNWSLHYGYFSCCFIIS